MQEEEGKMLLREIGCEDLYWMQLAQDCVKWPDFAFVALNLRMLFTESFNTYSWRKQQLALELQ
jgi:hypothetical protein